MLLPLHLNLASVSVTIIREVVLCNSKIVVGFTSNSDIEVGLTYNSTITGNLFMNSIIINL